MNENCSTLDLPFRKKKKIDSVIKNHTNQDQKSIETQIKEYRIELGKKHLVFDEFMELKSRKRKLEKKVIKLKKKLEIYFF